MPEKKINEDYILLLIENEGLIDTKRINIDNNFENELLSLKKLCEVSYDNINQITQFLQNVLKSKLTTKYFNYCKELDKPYQSVIVNFDFEIKDILSNRNLIYENEIIAKKTAKEYNLSEKINDLKNQIFQKISLWFKAFNIELAYEKAKKTTNMLVYSHRISGWSNPEYQITSNLKQQVKTNFGYGGVSYFYSLLTFKDIQITPLSEWIDYSSANFSNVIRYTRSYRSRESKRNEKGDLLYYVTTISNSAWHYAMDFTKYAANLSLTNEKEFIEQFILVECEKMVLGLEKFYENTEFEFVQENIFTSEGKKIITKRVDYKGFELINFRTEKIIGALDFLSKINEYNSITPTVDYVERIISVNKKFIPNVHDALNKEKEEYNNIVKIHNEFIIGHNLLNDKKIFYSTEKLLLKENFLDKYKDEYDKFNENYTNSLKTLNIYKSKIKLHSDNMIKFKEYISKYQTIVEQ
ncbi:hypothetical protein VT569_05235 [Flavobacterium psychrophilum]|uniref:hypothetical protein n=1 Tax=Flavobacterium psychrophilum TaxID=96345 RepID=UPI003B435033